MISSNELFKRSFNCLLASLNTLFFELTIFIWCSNSIWSHYLRLTFPFWFATITLAKIDNYCLGVLTWAWPWRVKVEWSLVIAVRWHCLVSSGTARFNLDASPGRWSLRRRCLPAAAKHTSCQCLSANEVYLIVYITTLSWTKRFNDRWWIQPSLGQTISPRTLFALCGRRSHYKDACPVAKRME